MSHTLCRSEYIDFGFCFTYYFGKAYFGLAKRVCV